MAHQNHSRRPSRTIVTASTPNTNIFFALLLLLLGPIILPASGFSTPRHVTTISKTPVAVASQSSQPAGGRFSSIRSRGQRLSAAASDGDDDENEPGGEEEEFETEATTTGLFIPGFSDKFAQEPDNRSRAPKITISNPIATKASTSSTVDIPPSTPPSTTKTKSQPALPPPTIVKDLSEDVSRSVIELPSLPSLPKLSLPPFFGRGERKNPSPPSKPPPPRITAEDAIASAVGGTLAGTLVGLYADVATDMLMDTDLPPLIPPVALGVVLGAGAFVGANQENFIGQTIRFIFGRPVLGVRNKITNKIAETVEDIKATPTRIKDAAVQKVDDVVDEIKATPGKIKDAAVQKVEDVVDEIKVNKHTACPPP